MFTICQVLSFDLHSAQRYKIVKYALLVALKYKLPKYLPKNK